MLSCNQEMIRSSLAFFRDIPPVIVDWVPWHHTAGGNHNFGIVLYNGGSLYIDTGKPTPKGIDEAFGGLDRESLTFLDGWARHGDSPRRRLKPGTVLVREYHGQR